MGQYVDFYCKDNNKELKKIVDPILKKRYGWLAMKDYDDFYSVAAQAVWECEKRFDSRRVKSEKFRSYVTACIHNRIKTQLSYMNRDKRIMKDEEGSPVYDVSIDAVIGKRAEEEKRKGEGKGIGELISLDYNMEEILLNRLEAYDEKTKRYLNGLSAIQRRIVEMKMEEIPVSEIKQSLKLSKKQYESYCKDMKSFANISILFGGHSRTKYKEDQKMSAMSTTTQTMENCKTDKISIASIIKKIDNLTIRFDHPLQRESDQWSPVMKSNLISDILQGNKLHPLIFAEQIINGVPIIWDLDGKQRCTNAYAFYKNGYKISKNIRRWQIRYQTIKKDKNGDAILDDNGFPIAVNREVDIRGRKFSDLPEELQDRFLEYNFNYDQYLNCSETDIGYHIERYNDGRPMTSSQKGLTRLGTEYAEAVKSITNMSFFKDLGGYKVSEFKNGTINRVVVESLMASGYLDKWNKLEDMCNYIKDNVEPCAFEDFEDMVGRLERVVTEETAELFDSKDSFLWFGLFARFLKMEKDDSDFIRFLEEFIRSLHDKEIDGLSFDRILEETKATKDKGIVTRKINHLERLMIRYFESVNPDQNTNRAKCKTA